jgi:adenylate cyclase
MAKEIERKFLTKPRKWSEMAAGVPIRQGYLSGAKKSTVRVRTAGPKAFLTVKGITTSFTRDEYEYEIPASDAAEMLEHLCERPIIEKTRYRIAYAGRTFEVDEFEGVNRGLTVAEVELEDENQQVELPEWIDREVTGDPRYYNANLVANPFSTWAKK